MSTAGFQATLPFMSHNWISTIFIVNCDWWREASPENVIINFKILVRPPKTCWGRGERAVRAVLLETLCNHDVLKLQRILLIKLKRRLFSVQMHPTCAWYNIALGQQHHRQHSTYIVDLLRDKQVDLAFELGVLATHPSELHPHRHWWNVRWTSDRLSWRQSAKHKMIGCHHEAAKKWWTHTWQILKENQNWKQLILTLHKKGPKMLHAVSQDFFPLGVSVDAFLICGLLKMAKNYQMIILMVKRALFSVLMCMTQFPKLELGSG